jgi:hypothetical protein
MSRILPLLLGATVLSVGAYAFYDQLATAAKPVNKAQPASSEEQDEPTTPRLQAPYERVTVPAAVLAPTASAAAAETSEAPPPEPPRLSENLEQYRDYLDSVFRNDARDRNWETTAESRIREGIAKAQVAGSRVVSLECRASLCKTVIDGGDQQTLSKVSDEIMHAFFWSGPGMVARAAPNSDTDFRLIAFFGREGRPVSRCRYTCALSPCQPESYGQLGSP